MNGPVTETQWYIARDGKQHGPLTDIEMRTFVAHSYLRATDLIWRPGMAEWLPAPQIFPAVFPAPSAAPAPQQAAPARAPQSSPQPASSSPSPAETSDFDSGEAEEESPRSGLVRRLITAAAVISVIGGGAFALATYREPLTRLVSGGSGDAGKPKSETADPSVAAATDSSNAPADEQQAAVAAAPPPGDAPAAGAKPADGAQPASDTAAAPSLPADETKTAALTPPDAPSPPPSIDGSQIDVRLQKIPVWMMIKKDYPDWYVSTVAAAEKLASDKRPESDIAAHLAQGLVTLRRQNAEKALNASPEKLRRVATAFLENLKSLQTQSVSACYGFISKGETSPAIVQLMQTPESATAFNAHVTAIFEAIEEGGKTPAKHAAAVKGDYDVLIKELGKIGWKEEDLQVFSNPRLLSKRPPDQVCKMVQDWFRAHLALTDAQVQERLLFETLKPVVGG